MNNDDLFALIMGEKPKAKELTRHDGSFNVHERQNATFRKNRQDFENEKFASSLQLNR